MGESTQPEMCDPKDKGEKNGEKKKNAMEVSVTTNRNRSQSLKYV